MSPKVLTLFRRLNRILVKILFFKYPYLSWIPLSNPKFEYSYLWLKCYNRLMSRYVQFCFSFERETYKTERAILPISHNPSIQSSGCKPGGHKVGTSMNYRICVCNYRQITIQQSIYLVMSSSVKKKSCRYRLYVNCNNIE